MTWPPPLLLSSGRLPWSLDATRVGLEPAALAALAWPAAFAEMRALEDGAIANPDEDRQVGHYWLRDPTRAPTIADAQAITAAQEACRTLAASVLAGSVGNDVGDAFTDVVHVGIGGSALGPQFLVAALGTDEHGTRRGMPIHFVDNTDPDGLTSLIGRLGARLDTTLVVVASKSGGTAEPNAALNRLIGAFRARGITPAPNLVAITSPGSALDRRADAEGWLARLPVWAWVGGRFSLSSAVGLLPAELAGIDTAAFLDGAAAMDDWTRSEEVLTNPAAVLAGSWYLLGQGTGARDLVVLPYADRLEKLGRYLQQLVMESVGKRLDRQGKVVQQGLTVYGNKGSTDQHAFVQQLRDGTDDTLVTFVQVLEPSVDDPDFDGDPSAGDQLQGFLLGTRRALSEAGRPSITLTVPTVDALALGGLLALFERAVGLYASLVDLNAYHQPGVEAGKLAAGQVLALRARILGAVDGSTADQLADRLEADPMEVLYLLQRMARRGLVRADEDGANARWRPA